MKNLMSKLSNLPMGVSVIPIALILVLWTNLGSAPILDQSIVASKYIVIILAGLVMMTWYFVHSFKKGALSFLKTPFTLPMALFGGITLISLFANNQYPVESLLNVGGVMLALAVIVLNGSLLVKHQTNSTSKILNVIGFSSVALLVTSLLQQFGVGPSLLLNKLLGLNLPNNALFSLSGSNLVSLQIALIAAVGFSTKVFQAKKAKLWESIVLAVSAISIVYYGWLLLPGKATTLVILSPTASWSVAVDSLRSLKTALLGVGPDNYLQAYNLNMPTWINNSEYWNVQFSQGANVPLSIVVSLGIFGLIAWALLVVNTLKQTKSVSNQTKPVHMMILTAFVIQLFMPLNIVLLAIQAVLMVFWVAGEKDKFAVYSLNLKGVLARAILGLLAVGSLSLVALLGVATYSSHLMYLSSKAAINNDFDLAYSLQQRAIKLNPYLDGNRRKYAVTNIFIAAAISQKADLSEDEKKRFAQLIQQSVKEVKASILLDGKDVANWLLAAQVYQTLIGVAENSEEWSASAYAEAIKLAPNNPETRLVLGGVLFSAKQYEDALKFFEQAAVLKPNYANAYYNGANTLKMLRRFDEAKLAYQKTLILLQPDSDDYLKAADELQELEKIAKEAIDKKSPEATNTLPDVNPVEDVTLEVKAPPVENTQKTTEATPSAKVVPAE